MMFMVRYQITLLTLLVMTACSTGVYTGPELPNRTLLGYQCSEDATCGERQRCYKRFPNSVGRCVHERYWESADRGCATDSGCLHTEICVRHPSELHGVCAQRFGALSPALKPRQ